MTRGFRTATLDDAESVATVYLRSRRELVAFAPLVHSEEAVRDWIRGALIASGHTTVAVVDGQVLCLSDGFVPAGQVVPKLATNHNETLVRDRTRAAKRR